MLCTILFMYWIGDARLYIFWYIYLYMFCIGTLSWYAAGMADFVLFVDDFMFMWWSINMVAYDVWMACQKVLAFLSSHTLKWHRLFFLKLFPEPDTYIAFSMMTEMLFFKIHTRLLLLMLFLMLLLVLLLRYHSIHRIHMLCVYCIVW